MKEKNNAYLLQVFLCLSGQSLSSIILDCKKKNLLDWSRIIEKLDK